MGNKNKFVFCLESADIVYIELLMSDAFAQNFKLVAVEARVCYNQSHCTPV